MRMFFIMATAVLTATATFAQTNSPPPLNFPMPPPEAPVITSPDGRDVPSRMGAFSDRSTRCLQYGTSIGVPANQIQDYVKRCSLQ
jgi:hypothetical protein